MKYEVGDTVLLLHSNEEGRVVEIMNENMVMVNVDGIEFPVHTDQIDFPYFKRFSEQTKKKKEEKTYIDNIPREKSKSHKTKSDNGVYFSFVPVYDTSLYEDNIDHFKLYLINQNNEAYRFEFRVQYKDVPDFVISNSISPHSDFYLNNISQEELNDIARFQFVFSLEKPDKKKMNRTEKDIRVKAKIFFSKIEEMHNLNVPSFSFDLFREYPEKPAEEYFPLPEKKPKPIRNVSSSSDVRSVVDLHIEKIVDNYRGLSNFEIMQIQLNYFEKYYRISVNAMQPKLIVIHGVGSGRLKHEIHEMLNSRKEVKSFVNQYHPDFGFGATEIYFQY